VLVSLAVITVAVGGSVGGSIGVDFPLYGKAAGNSYPGFSRSYFITYRALLLLRVPPNIRRVHQLGKSSLAGFDLNWSDSDAYTITFPLIRFDKCAKPIFAKQDSEDC
jgi:hypothetical protein